MALARRIKLMVANKGQGGWQQYSKQMIAPEDEEVLKVENEVIVVGLPCSIKSVMQSDC